MHTKPSDSILLIALMILHAVFLISPIVYFLGFRASLVIPGTVLLSLSVVAIHDRRVPTWVILLVLGSLITSCISGVYWESWKAAFLPAYFGASMLTVAVASKNELQKVVRVSSVILLLLLIGGWIAVVLAFGGIPPLDTVSGLHGRVLHMYYTTLTPTLVGNYIRPAGIYDEPGALSLVVCVFAFLRHLMGMDRRFTWALMILGFVTFSLAHLVYVAIHFMAERRIWVAWTNLIVVSCAAIWVLSSSGIWDTFDARLIARLSVSSDSEKLVAGDNRTKNFIHAMEVAKDSDSRVLLFGVDSSCIEGSPLCKQKHPGLAFNPLSPLLQFGFLISWPYYVFLAIAIAVGAVRRSWWPFLAVGLLFMQRPNLFSAGYAMLGALTLVAAVRWSLLHKLFAAVFGHKSRVSTDSAATLSMLKY